MSNDKKAQLKVENKILPKIVETDLSKNAWKEIQEVALSERVVNGKMLNIGYTLFKMFKNGTLHLKEYFDQKDQLVMSNMDNAQILEEIVYDQDKEKNRTLGNAHFTKFANRVIVLSLGKNLKTFNGDYPDEYRVIRDVTPFVLWWCVNDQYVVYGKKNNPFTTPNDEKTPIRFKISYEYFESFGDKYDSNEFLQMFYLKGKMGTDFVETFRGVKGVLALSEFSFKSKTDRDSDAGTAEESPLYKTYKKVVETLKTNQNIEKGTSGIAPKRRANEIGGLDDILTQSINNLLNSKTPEAYTIVFNHYLFMVEIIETNYAKEFKTWLNQQTKTSNKVEYSPRVNGNKWDITSGDLLKRISVA